jgi:hypothetical protein
LINKNFIEIRKDPYKYTGSEPEKNSRNSRNSKETKPKTTLTNDLLNTYEACQAKSMPHLNEMPLTS